MNDTRPDRIALSNALIALNIETTGKDIDVLVSALADEGYRLTPIGDVR